MLQTSVAHSIDSRVKLRFFLTELGLYGPSVTSKFRHLSAALIPHTNTSDVVPIQPRVKLRFLTELGRYGPSGHGQVC